MVRRHMNSQMRSQRSSRVAIWESEREKADSYWWSGQHASAWHLWMVCWQAQHFSAQSVINKVVGNKTTVASGQKVVNSTKVSTNTSSDVDLILGDMVEKCTPSVVSITNLSVQQVQWFLLAVFVNKESQSSGSGIGLSDRMIQSYWLWQITT